MLLRQGEAYSSRVVSLAKVAVDTTCRGGVDNTAVLLFEEVGPGSLSDLIGATSVNVHDGVPEVVIHVGEGLVAEDTGVVDDDIDTAKGINSSLDNGITVLSRELGTDGLATHLLDLVNNIIGVDKVIDNDGSTGASKGQAVSAANTGTTTSNKGNAAREVDLLALLAGAELLRLLKEGQEVVRAAGVLGVGEVGNLIPLLDDGAGSVAVVGLEQETVGPLPSELGNVATTNLENGARLAGVVLVDEDGNKRHNPLRLHESENI